MLSVTQTSTGLLLAAPTWLGILFLLMGVGLIVVVVLARTPRGQALAARVPFVQVRIATAVLAVIAAAYVFYAGVALLLASALFEQRGVIVSSTFGEVDRVAWSQVQRFEIEELARGRGRALYLILYLRNGDYVPIGVSGLDAEGSLRLQNFVKERIKR
jgi:hypothetical protein